jgi:hypothetical protein
MTDELSLLFDFIPDSIATNKTYKNAVINENCLGKKSQKTRELTFRDLNSLYGLDSAIPIFNLLRFFWNRDVNGRIFSAALVAYARDPIFRISTSFILNQHIGSEITQEMFEDFVEKQHPTKLSAGSLRSRSSNIKASWTKTGHLVRNNRRLLRSKIHVTYGNCAIAIILAIMMGHRGRALFDFELIRLLDLSPEGAMDLAQNAAEKDWIIFKKIGDIVEVGIPDHISTIINKDIE